MTVLVYAPECCDGRLQQSIEAVLHKRITESYRTIPGLLARLRHPLPRPTVAVLYAATRQDLGAFLEMGDLLAGIRIILILPDRSSETVAMGHKILPRFIGYRDGELKDVAAVLTKILGRKSGETNRKLLETRSAKDIPDTQ